MCEVILDICAEKRVYEDFFGSLAQRCCSLRKECGHCFEKMFRYQYEIAHRLESFKLRIVATFFAYLLSTDAISWKVCNFFFQNKMHYFILFSGT